MSKIKAKDNINYIKNTNGPTLGYSTLSGVGVINEDGKFFKDLNKDGKLDKYEDWRLSPDERAQDLASKMSIEQIAGIMLYSTHQAIPASLGWSPATYNGKSFVHSGMDPDDLSDQQKEFITKDHIRHVLITAVQSTETVAYWNNNIQSLAESSDLGIPINNSSDPRHTADSSKEFNAGAGGKISMWPEAIGLAATFDPSLTEKFGSIAAKEYRALGLTTALSPQIDIATDPRWNRFGMSFGEDPMLAADMARAYIDGFQTSVGDTEISGGWGIESVNAMAKHWPGGGSGEAGRDAHFGYGKYAVYPGDNFEQHLIPFTEGAFRLDGPTGHASAVMPYYTISYGQDPSGENSGNSYNSYIIQDLLRNKFGYDGVVCTDWGITSNEPEDITRLGGRCWGVEEGYSVAERHYKLLMAGVDQFGGNNEITPIIEAFQIGVKVHGEVFMRKRFEQSAVRLLRNMFRLGLFENPYLEVDKSVVTVGNAEFMEAGFDAQLKSLVILKNKHGVLPLQRNQKVYIPQRYRPSSTNWFGIPTPEVKKLPISEELVSSYFDLTDNPEDADFALVFIESPITTYGYSKSDIEVGGNGYVPISLQYRPYTAEYAREESIAGDPRDILNRTYKNKTVQIVNESDLDAVLTTKERMKGKPVIVSLQMNNPAIVNEFEQEVTAIVANFGVQDQAILDVLVGRVEPTGLLPFQMPANMRTVEEQFEDVPHDMQVHVDSEGNEYDFAFGLNWKGIIRDERTSKYTIK
ncbi:glycoside hydrolase family 3 N-terminal domain-containing protein [Paenibacillus sp. NPDC057934]|uniref:glycoside hydrolase family 3 protein n=1 Tax=Paenibacillus sp. NPDC057934 TaxID=3346282 RepID=UPI0036D87874